VSKTFKGQQCAYCSARDAVTGDHIFAREFFVVAARANLPQAPICAECNNEKSKLEHYLTTVLPFGGRHAHASENLAVQVPKRLVKNAKLHRHLMAGQQVVSVPGDRGSTKPTLAIPFDGEKLEQLFSMIVRGLVWYHWRVYLQDGYKVQTHTVTAYGMEMCEETLFRKNARNRIRQDVGGGTFTYEGAQAFDDPGITVRKFSVYGGLASYENEVSPQNLGSHLVSMTGPAASFNRART
jgi:hypothetical protein